MALGSSVHHTLSQTTCTRDSGSRTTRPSCAYSVKTWASTFRKTLTQSSQPLRSHRTNRMARASKSGPTVATITETSRMVLKKDKVSISGPMVQSTQATGRMTR